MQMIRVNPDELATVAGTLQSSIRDMDAAMSHALEQLTGIRDRAKGLDEIRDRARQLQQVHRQQVATGQEVQQHIAQSAQRFSETDQQLGGQMALNVAGAALAAGMPIPTQLQQWMANNSDLLKQIGTLMLGGVLAPVAPVALTTWLMQQGLSNSAAWQGIHSALDLITDIDDLAYLAAGWKPLMEGLGKVSESLLAHGKLNWLHNAVSAFASNELGGVTRIEGLAKGVEKWFLLGQGISLGMSAFNFARSVASGDRDAIVDSGGKFLGDGLIMAASATKVGAAVYGISSLLQLGGGVIASGMEWFGYGEQAQKTREVLEVIDLRAHTQKLTTKWFDGVVSGIEYAAEKTQDFVDYVSEKAPSWIKTGVDIARKADDFFKKIPPYPFPFPLPIPNGGCKPPWEIAWP